MPRRYQDDDDYPENETSTQAWWDERDRRMKADIAADREYAKTADAIAHQLSIHEGSIVRENMDPERWETQRVALVGKLDAARAREQAEDEASTAVRGAAEAIEWTREVTIKRRATWNARVKAGEFTNPNGTANPAKAAAALRTLGWTAEAMKRAIARHGL